MISSESVSGAIDRVSKGPLCYSGSKDFRGSWDQWSADWDQWSADWDQWSADWDQWSADWDQAP